MNKNNKSGEAQGVQTEKSKMQVIDIAPAIQINRGVNLEQTIQVVMGLGKKIRMAQNLKTQASQLEEFEIKSEGDYLNHHLTIEDSNRRNFTTKDAQVIKDVVEFIRQRIFETVVELEANIVLP